MSGSRIGNSRGSACALIATFLTGAGRADPATGKKGGLKWIALVLGVIALSVVPAGTALAATGQGAAAISRDTFTSQFTDSAVDDCRGIAGTIVGTSVFQGQLVETSQGFHVHGTITDTGRIDWVDGTYTLVDSIDRFAHNIGKGTEEFTIAHVDSGNTYTADGLFLYRYTHHEEVHVTVTNGVIVRVDFGKGRFHFFGDC